MRGKLTKRAVEALKPKTTDVFLWDSQLPGFGLRVKPSGVRSFMVAYYAPNLHRVRRRLTLGTYGTMTVDAARMKARSMLAAIANGTDPAKDQVEKRRAAKDETVGRLFEDYLDYGRGRFKATTVDSYEAMARLYIMPALGNLPVAQVTVRDVARLHYDLRDKPIVGNRVVQLVKAFFYWLERRELFQGRNPARGLEMYAEKPRQRFLTVEEMARLGQALRVAEKLGLPPAPEHRRKGKKKSKKRARNPGMFTSKLGHANPVAVAALRFLLFSGWRESEALTLRWSDVNMRTGIATLPDTKTGESVRSLGAPALEVLAAQPRVKGSPYVFPGRDPQHPLEGVRRLWHAARSEAQLEDVRLHDIRHSVASIAGGRGYSLYLIGKLLGHKTARSTERYAHLADDARKVMADDVGELIRTAMESDTARVLGGRGLVRSIGRPGSSGGGPSAGTRSTSPNRLPTPARIG